MTRFREHEIVINKVRRILKVLHYFVFGYENK